MKAKHRLIAGAVIAAAALIALGGFAVRSVTGGGGPQYITVPAQIASIEHTVLATGAVQPAEVVEVGAQASGQITAMNVDLGDHVAAGELLAVIESFQLVNQVRRAEQGINRATSQLNNARNNLVLQTANLEREEQLLERGVSTEVKVEQARNSLASARASVTQQESNLKDSEIALLNAQNELDKSNIRAPISGVVAEVVAGQGQTINTQREVPTIVKVAQMDRMTIRAQISEADIIRINPGQRVYFTILGDPDRKYEATLRARELTPVGGELDPSGGGVQKDAIYYNAQFEVDNSDGVLLPGMTAEVRVVLDEAADVLTIPSAALGERNADGSYMVKVINGEGEAVERRIVTGLNNSALVEVRSGLEAGDQVVIGEAGAGGSEVAASSGGLLGFAQN